MQQLYVQVNNCTCNLQTKINKLIYLKLLQTLNTPSLARVEIDFNVPQACVPPQNPHISKKGIILGRGKLDGMFLGHPLIWGRLGDSETSLKC